MNPSVPLTRCHVSAFSAAASEVLAGYSGSDRMYDGWTRLGRDYDGDGFEDLFGQDERMPYSVMANLTLTY